MTPTRLRSSSCQQQRRPAGGELKSESQIRQQPAGSPGPANQMQIRPPHAGRVRLRRRPSCIACAERGWRFQPSERPRTRTRARARKKIAVSAWTRPLGVGGMHGLDEIEIESAAPCLPVDTVVSGCWRPSPKRKAKEIPEETASCPLSSLSLSLPVEGRRVVQSASSYRSPARAVQL